MSPLPRYIVALLIVGLAFIGIVRLLNLPPESYLPPPDLYNRATGTAHGYVTRRNAAGLGDHLLEGSNTFYYMHYKFQPYVYMVKPDGKQVLTQETTWYKGTVRVGEQTYMGLKTSEPVKVVYDPADLKINGVPGTRGLWNTGSGYLNPYLWWYVGILVITWIIQEIIRTVTKTADY